MVLGDISPFLPALNNHGTRPDDSALVQLLRQRFLLPPSQRPITSSRRPTFPTGEYEGVRPRLVTDRNASWVYYCFADDNDDTGGGIEKRCSRLAVIAGGYDGKYLSIIIFMESFTGWSGLIIEPVHQFLPDEAKNRKALLSCSYLSTEPYPTVVCWHGIRVLWW